MPKCRDNRRARLRRRKREERRLERRAEERSANSWLCWCGEWIEDGMHCPACGPVPPWGCDCGCREERYDEHEDLDEHFEYDDDFYNEPVGSCEWCGVNLYPDDDEELCGQCLWHASLNEGSEDVGGSGIMPMG